MTLDYRTLSGIFEVYSRLHPAMRDRASWRMGIEAWEALRRDPRLKDAVVELPANWPSPGRSSLCGLPVLIGSDPHADVELAIRTMRP